LSSSFGTISPTSSRIHAGCRSSKDGLRPYARASRPQRGARLSRQRNICRQCRRCRSPIDVCPTGARGCCPDISRHAHRASERARRQPSCAAPAGRRSDSEVGSGFGQPRLKVHRCAECACTKLTRVLCRFQFLPERSAATNDSILSRLAVDPGPSCHRPKFPS